MNQRIFLLLCIIALFSFETIAKSFRGNDLSDFSDDDEIDQEYSLIEGEDDIIQGELANFEAADDMDYGGSNCVEQLVCTQVTVPRTGVVQTVCQNQLVCP